MITVSTKRECHYHDITGMLHRIDGPAVKWYDGEEWYYLGGIHYSKEYWFSLLTSEQKENYIWDINEIRKT